MIKADIEMPPGTLIHDEPPIHTIHRSLLSRVFTPKSMNAIEPAVREFCVRRLDPLVGSDGFDVVAELGLHVPMRVFGMLLGIPDEDQEAVRDHVEENMRTEPGKPQTYEGEVFGSAEGLRAVPRLPLRAPGRRSDHAADQHRVQGRQREGPNADPRQALMYLNVIAGAGNHTTNRLIGWTARCSPSIPTLAASW